MKSIFIILMLFMLGCGNVSKKHEGKIVKDYQGNYYRVTGERAFGHERYRLIQIDTITLKKF